MASVLRRSWCWLADHPYTISTGLLAAAVAFSFQIDASQDNRERREDAVERVDLAEHDARFECRSANQSRELIRDIGVQLNMASAESLIAIADDPEPERVVAYREQSRANAVAIVAQLADRDCEAEATEARHVAAEIEGIEP